MNSWSGSSARPAQQNTGRRPGTSATPRPAALRRVLPRRQTPTPSSPAGASPTHQTTHGSLRLRSPGRRPSLPASSVTRRYLRAAPWMRPRWPRTGSAPRPAIRCPNASWPRCSDAHPAAGRAPESPKHGEHRLQGSRWIRQSPSALNPSRVSATAPSRTFCRRSDVSNRLAVHPGSGNPGVLLCRLGGRRDGRSGGGRGRYRSADRYPARTRDTLFCLSRSGRDHDAEMTPV